jgi:uncharacterized repeat protein (TIGR03803 family)
MTISVNVLVSFNGTAGSYPLGCLIADAGGDLFGMSMFGGADNEGTVFEITGSGFVPPRPAPDDFTGDHTSDILLRDTTGGGIGEFAMNNN